MYIIRIGFDFMADISDSDTSQARAMVPISYYPSATGALRIAATALALSLDTLPIDD